MTFNGWLLTASSSEYLKTGNAPSLSEVLEEHPDQKYSLSKKAVHRLLKQGITENQGIRRLTPLECERLQAFPDNWTEKGIIDGKEVNISDTQRYKTLGNAVTTKVIKEIVRKILFVPRTKGVSSTELKKQ